ncbi:hypothetical protein ACFFMN_34085 [Planobispora siamensis]|uniref:Uncharacterized protein n=1 Tax=Planobispora siamensis TaxID=936338 RepID=A0A8J3SC29_9ACTN|nr:hypothetical protein [Planobispora siamensis]GIH91916.1 hypothetical protein Psi01_25460 [Planobispora siamensis]
MNEMERSESTGGAIAAAGGVLTTVVYYAVVIVRLVTAGIKLRGLSEQVRGTYRYVEGCATGTDRLADQMARLTVDRDTVGEHHDAATVMRGALAEAEAMAEASEDLSTMFRQTAIAHQADYGSVAEAAAEMNVPMAEAEFYSNR